MKNILCIVLLLCISFTWAQEVVGCMDCKIHSQRKLSYLTEGITNYKLPNVRNHYNWPFQPFGQASPVGHVSHSYQKYGGQAYFHHGIDIRANAGTNIYASSGGKVVNIENYIPGNSLYWEVAIRDEQGFLWQYHHVERNSIPNQVCDAYKNGGSIATGAIIGKVVYWPAKSYGTNFHHIHLNVLDGNGKFINPFQFLVAPADMIAPTIDEIYFTEDEGSQTIAKNALRGDIDIIARAQDLMDDQPYQQTIYKMEYEIQSLSGKSVFPKTALWKFDSLPGGSDINKDVFTVYKRSFWAGNKYLSTSGNYSRREFYFIVTNQQNGKVVTSGAWHTNAKDAKGKALYPNGKYRVTVHATDFNGNTTSKSVEVEVKN